LGITRLKRLITEELSKAFNTSEIGQFAGSLLGNVDLYDLTGYPPNSSIPRKEAAKQVVEHLYKLNKIAPLLNYFIYVAQTGFRGEGVKFSNMKSVIHEMKECGYHYDRDLNKVVLVEKNASRSDWGFLEEDSAYNCCFISIDISKNSKLVRKYDNSLIQKTYINFKELVTKAVETRKGRIWNWEGDGGLIAFHVKDFVNLALLSAVDILSSMPLFNSLYNCLPEDIMIRIALNAGKATYKKDTVTINSEAISKVRQLEKKHTELMTITISESTFSHIDTNLRKNFKVENVNNENIYQLRFPVGGVG